MDVMRTMTLSVRSLQMCLMMLRKTMTETASKYSVHYILWTRQTGPNSTMIGGTTMQDVKMKSLYFSVMLLNILGNMLKHGQKVVGLQLSHKFFQRTPIMSLSYVVK